MVVDLAGEVGVVLLRALQHHARPIRQLVRGKVYLAKTAFSDQAAKGVVSDGSKVGRGELCEERLVGVGKLGIAVSGQRKLLGHAARQSDSSGIYLFPLVLQLELGLRPDRWHMRSLFGFAVTERMCAVVMRVPCSVDALSPGPFPLLFTSSALVGSWVEA